MSHFTLRGPLVGASILLSLGHASYGASATRTPFGTLSSGETVEMVTLSNAHGIKVRLMTLGASVQAIETPDRDGKSADIVLGYDTPREYEANPQYFGATVGRFANRIAKGRFSLDGKTYQLPLNNGVNSLHGGTRGFDKVVWNIDAVENGSVTFSYHSTDGDQGYPGNLTATARYALDEHDALTLELRATTDKPTIVNLSNHTFFNLAGVQSPDGVLQQVLTLPATRYTPVDATLIPTGELRSVAGTPFDFRAGKPMGRDIRDAHDEQIRFGRGFDHNFVQSEARARDVTLLARVADPVSGRVLELWSNQPGVQFYTGNFLDGTVMGKGKHLYRQGDGFALEPQIFPDTPNQPAFGSARLDPGQIYLNKIVYRFSSASR